MNAATRALACSALVAAGCMVGVHGAGAPPWAVAILPSGEEFTLELATDDASRARGYMFRDSVGSGEGMLFVFDESGSHGFWMKNCKIALDIIWLDPDFRVVDIAHERQPCPARGDCPTVFPMRAARYVLELAGGTARRAGLERGHRISVLAEPPLH
jgi:hypothetical protein